jgi:hypothetical protein
LSGIEILMAETFAKINATDHLRLAKQAARRKRNWSDSSVDNQWVTLPIFFTLELGKFFIPWVPWSRSPTIRSVEQDLPLNLRFSVVMTVSSITILSMFSWRVPWNTEPLYKLILHTRCHMSWVSCLGYFHRDVRPLHFVGVMQHSRGPFSTRWIRVMVLLWLFRMVSMKRFSTNENSRQFLLTSYILLADLPWLSHKSVRDNDLQFLSQSVGLLVKTNDDVNLVAVILWATSL